MSGTETDACRDASWIGPENAWEEVLGKEKGEGEL